MASIDVWGSRWTDLYSWGHGISSFPAVSTDTIKSPQACNWPMGMEFPASYCLFVAPLEGIGWGCVGALHYSGSGGVEAFTDGVGVEAAVFSMQFGWSRLVII